MSTKMRRICCCRRTCERYRTACAWRDHSKAQIAHPPRTAAEDIHTVYKSPRLCGPGKSRAARRPGGVFPLKNHVLMRQLGTTDDKSPPGCGAGRTGKNNNSETHAAASGQPAPGAGRGSQAMNPLTERRP